MKKSKKSLLIVLSLILVFCAACSNGGNSGENSVYSAENIAPSSDADIEHIKVCFDIENIGTFTVETYPEKAPETVEHFLNLVDKGYYNGASFEILNPGHSIVSSSLTALSSGECKETITGEFKKNGYSNDLKLTRGTLAFCYLPGEYNSATSKFMIFLGDDHGLDGSYAGFARVVDGTAVFDAISLKPINANNTPVSPIVMKKVYIKE